MLAKITKRLVDSVEAEEKELFVWDTELEGFGLRVQPSGYKSYVIQYRNAHGRTRRLALGRAGRLTPEEARSLARRRLSEVDQGSDPSAERDRLRTAPTVAQLAEMYLEKHSRPKKKPSSVAMDERLLRLFIVPRLGSLRVEAVTRADVAALHQELARCPTQANLVRSVLSKMMTLAEKWELRPDGSNPTRHVERYPSRRRERYLSGEEFARLGAVLEEEARIPARWKAALALRLLILTGARRGEILTLRWEDVIFEQRCLRLPDSKTGAKTIPLGSAALALLEAAPREPGSPWVIPGRSGARPLGPSHLVAAWFRIREQAGLPGVRLHDLRHSFASVGTGARLSLKIIGALLGHSNPATTNRYAHLAVDPFLEAAEEVSSRIAGALAGGAAQTASTGPRETSS
ncbi:MAG TPA: site-specific integrase [Thermoanaerobaculia bacterium]|nr:site-specific integrase [Thermoanaerobaculia bacterium]